MGGGQDPPLAHQGTPALWLQPIAVQQHGHPGELPHLGDLAIRNVGLQVVAAVVLHRLRVLRLAPHAANRVQALGGVLGLDKTRLRQAVLNEAALARSSTAAKVELGL